MPLKDYTAVALIVDRSGSMSNIAATVQSALEEFLADQVTLPGKLTIDTVFFDTTVENRATFVNPKDTKLDLELRPQGMTALFDAVGGKIDSFGQALSELPEEERPEKVIFVIATDGHENSSREYTQHSVAERIKHQTEVYAWDFTFIGANQDAVLTAASLNIPQSSAITFAANAEGAGSVVRAMSTYVAGTRSGASTGYTAEDRVSALGDGDDQVDQIKSQFEQGVANPTEVIVGGVRSASLGDFEPSAKLPEPEPRKATKPAVKRAAKAEPKSETKPRTPRKKAEPKKDAE